MKNFIIVLAVAALSGCACEAGAQVTIREIPEAVKRPKPYDSLENIQPPKKGEEHNVLRYIGQEIFIIPMSSKKAASEAIRLAKLDSLNRRLDRLSSPSPAERDRLKYEISKYKYPYSPFDTYPDVYAYKSTHRAFYGCDSVGKITSVVPYADVQNKYYTIVDVLMCSLNGSAEKSITSKTQKYTSDLAFLLKERDRGRYLLWYFYEPGMIIAQWQRTIALASSYVTKAKNLFEGKTLIPIYNSTGLEISTGEKVAISKDSKWICREISLVSTHVDLMKPYFILEDQAGNTVKIEMPQELGPNSFGGSSNIFITEQKYLEDRRLFQIEEEKRLARDKEIKEDNRKMDMQWAAERQKYINMYGGEFGNAIANMELRVGMSKKMCKLAWGEPSDVRHAQSQDGVGEQWYYESRGYYLFFRGDILTAVQKDRKERIPNYREIPAY